MTELKDPLELAAPTDLDTAAMDAIDAGDLETAERLVREAEERREKNRVAQAIDDLKAKAKERSERAEKNRKAKEAEKVRKAALNKAKAAFKRHSDACNKNIAALGASFEKRQAALAEINKHAVAGEVHIPGLGVQRATFQRAFAKLAPGFFRWLGLNRVGGDQMNMESIVSPAQAEELPDRYW